MVHLQSVPKPEMGPGETWTVCEGWSAPFLKALSTRHKVLFFSPGNHITFSCITNGYLKKLRVLEKEIRSPSRVGSVDRASA